MLAPLALLASAAGTSENNKVLYSNNNVLLEDCVLILTKYHRFFASLLFNLDTCLSCSSLGAHQYRFLDTLQT